MANNEILRVLVGVAGGSSIAGESGKEILKDLKIIAAQISSGGHMRVKVGLDQTNTQLYFQQELQKIINNVQLRATIKADVNTDTSNESYYQGVLTQQKAVLATALAQASTADERRNIQANLNALIKQERVENQLSGIVEADNLETKAKIVKAQAKLTQSEIKYRQAVEDSKNADQAAEKKKLSALKAVRNFQLQITKILDNTYNLQDGTRSRLESLFNNVNSDNLQESKVALSNIKLEMQQTGQTADDLGTKLKKAFSTHIKDALITAGFALIRQTIRDVVDEVVTLDTSMTELKKVSNASQNDLAVYFNNARKEAVDLHAELDTLIDATANFARLGFNIGESSTLGRTATIFANVGDDISSIDNATESIISTMKAFKIEAEDSMEIVDKFNEVGNNFAISSGGVAEALQRSASALAVANNTIDESIALITAGNTIVQDPTSVGTTLKTLSMRIRGAKTELEAAGEETEGMVENTAKLQEKIMALTGGAVDIMLNEDTFKSTYQILKEISQVWKSLDDISQASLLELIAGKRNANVAAAIITDFTVAEQVLKSSTNAAGSAMVEYSQWLDSIEAKQQKFHAQFQDFSAAFLNNEFVAGTYDTGAGFLGFLTSIVETLGTIPTLATAATAALSLKNIPLFDHYDEGPLKGNWFNEMLSGMLDGKVFNDMAVALELAGDEVIDLSKDMQRLSPPARKVAMDLKQASKSGKDFAVALRSNSAEVTKLGIKARASAAGVKLLKSAMATIGTMAASVAISLLINGISEWIHKNEELRQSALESSQELQSELDSIDAYADKIQSLKDSLDSGTLSTEDAYEARKELMLIQDELIEKYGDEAGSIDLLNGSLETQLALLRNLSTEQISDNVRRNEKAYANAQKYLDKQRNSSAGLSIIPRLDNELFSTLQSEIANLGGGYTNSDTYAIQVDFANKTAEEQIAAWEHLYDVVNEYGKRAGRDAIDNISLVLQQISGQINKFDNTKYQENKLIFEQISAQKAMSDYGDPYYDLLEIQDRYDEALAQGASQEDLSAIAEEYVNNVNSFLDDPQNSEMEKGVRAFFENLRKSFIDNSAAYLMFGDEANKVLAQSIADAGLTSAELLDSDNESLSQLVEKAKEFGYEGTEAIDWVIQKLIAFGYVVDDTKQKNDELTESLTFKEINTKIDDLQSAYSTLSSAVAEYNSAGKISIDTLQSLLSLDTQYLSMLQMQDGQLKLNDVSTRNYITALKMQKVEELQTAAAEDILAYAQGRTADMSLAAQMAVNNLTTAMADAGTTGTVSAAGIFNFAASVASIANIQLDKLNLGQQKILNYYEQCADAVWQIGTNMSMVEVATNGAASAASNLKSQLSTAKSDIQGLLDMTISMLRQQYRDSAEAQKESIQSEIDAVKDLQEAEKEATEEALDGIRRRIEAEIELLDKQKESRDYQKSLNEKESAVADLENQIAEIAYDDSAEGTKRRLELEEELAEKRSELEDFQFDHNIDTQKEILEAELENAEQIYQNKLELIEAEYEARLESLQDQLDAVSDYTASEAELRAEAIALIEGRSEEFYQALLEWNREYGTGIDADVTGKWNAAYKALEQYNYQQLGVQGVLELLTEQMYQLSDAVGGVAGAFNGVLDKMNAVRDGFAQVLVEGYGTVTQLSQWMDQLNAGINADRVDTTYERNALASAWDAKSYGNATYGETADGVGSVTKNPSKSAGQLAYERSGSTMTYEAWVRGQYNTAKMQGNTSASFEDWRRRKGYATGGVDTSGGLAMLHGSLRAPEVIFNAEDAKKLWNFVNESPNLLNDVFRGLTLKTPTSSSFENNVGDIKVEINIAGNADSGTVASLRQEGERIVQQIYDGVIKNINKNANNRGVSRNTKHRLV